MLSEASVHELLEPFGVSLSGLQVAQILAYLELLLRWNRRINLTAIRSPEECVTRHFGESLFLARVVRVGGRLLDIGSGAGFPGLALKIVAPDLVLTLLEPVAKKRAFLKEASRVCGMTGVEVLGQRLDTLAEGGTLTRFDLATARAVGDFGTLIPDAVKCLKPNGKLCLWLGTGQTGAIRSGAVGITWDEPVAIPLSRQRVILIGTRHGSRPAPETSPHLFS